MSLHGYLTRSDLSTWGNILSAVLLGVIVCSVVNMFLKSSMLTWTSSILGVMVFAALTAYDTQKIRDRYYGDGSNTANKHSIVAALALYLDFINLLLFLFRILENAGAADKPFIHYSNAYARPF